MKNRKKELKGFVFGVILTVLLSSTVVMANPVMQEIFFGVSVRFNGAPVSFEHDMRPFTMDGRTFLPVRAVADLLGVEVDFDADTNTVLLTTGDVPTVPVTQPVPQLPMPTPQPTEPEPTPQPEEPEPQPAEEPEPEAEQEPAPTLIGTWLWMGMPYYVFESGGHGTMAGMDIRWSADRGVLTICATPEICGDACPAPHEWHYVIDGNQLTLTSRQIADMYFTYTRQ